MTIWNQFPDLSESDFRTLVAVSAGVLLESDEGKAGHAASLLQQSPATSAKQAHALLSQADSAPREVLSAAGIKRIFEDEELGLRACKEVLTQIRSSPQLAERVANEFSKRKQKMASVELTLLSGALVVLAMRIKKISWGDQDKKIDFSNPSEAVKAFVLGLLGALPKL